jgi:hypothetical protein
MNEILDEIKDYVKGEIESMSKSELNTLRALLYSGYKGEREQVLLKLLRMLGENRISPCSLIESFKTTFEDGKTIRYWRIKPELFRATRELLLKT